MRMSIGEIVASQGPLPEGLARHLECRHALQQCQAAYDEYQAACNALVAAQEARQAVSPDEASGPEGFVCRVLWPLQAKEHQTWRVWTAAKAHHLWAAARVRR